MINKQERILQAFLELKEGSLDEFNKKFRSVLGSDKISPEMEEEVRQELDADYERVKRETGWQRIEEDDEDMSEDEIREAKEAEETLREHSRETLTQFGLWREGSGTIKESGRIKENRIYEPAKTTKVSSGNTIIREEGTDRVGTEKDGLVMVGPGIWLPKELAKNGNDEEIWEYMMENRIGM